MLYYWLIKEKEYLYIDTLISFTIKQNVMSLKYSSTTADYLQWSEAMNLIRKLARDSNYKMSLLISVMVNSSASNI